MCLIISAILINTVIYEFTNNRGEHKLAFDSFLYIGTSLTNYVNDFKTSVDKYINHFSPYIWPPQDTMVGLIGNLIFDLWGLIVTIVTTLLVLLLVIIAILCLTSQTKSRAVYKFKT